MDRRRRLTGVAALSAATLATLATAAPAAAVECEICGTFPPPGITIAGLKVDESAMDKWLGLAAFDKIGELGFPGATDGAFLKFK
jgi:hypothetical protein